MDAFKNLMKLLIFKIIGLLSNIKQDSGNVRKQPQWSKTQHDNDWMILIRLSYNIQVIDKALIIQWGVNMNSKCNLLHISYKANLYKSYYLSL